MDKSIVDKLIQFGLITNIDVDAEKYDGVDDLIEQGVITIPGIKNRILEIIGEETEHTTETVETTISEPINEVFVATEPVIDETPESEPVIDEVPVSEPVIDETPESEPVIVDEPVEAEIVTETNEIVVEETTKKTKKAKKN